MPAYWSDKDERQYEAIRASCLARDGRKTRACKRIAAATVNKQRRREGRTLGQAADEVRYDGASPYHPPSRRRGVGWAVLGVTVLAPLGLILWARRG